VELIIKFCLVAICVFVMVYTMVNSEIEHARYYDRQINEGNIVASVLMGLFLGGGLGWCCILLFFN